MELEQKTYPLKEFRDRMLARELETWRVRYMEAAVEGSQNLALMLREKAEIYEDYGDDQMAGIYRDMSLSGLSRPQGLGSRTPLEIHRFKTIDPLPALNGSHK